MRQGFFLHFCLNFISMRRIVLAVSMVLLFQNCWTQGLSLLPDSSKASFSLSGFADMYFGKQRGNFAQKPSFFYNHRVNNQLRTNLLLLKGELELPRFHATLGLMTGDYSRYNLAAEPLWARPLNEAYVGIKLSKNRSLWWDIGVYSSYLGIESAVSADCPTLTRSIVAENSPYYLSGSRLLFISKNKKHEAGIHVLNGWQRIAWDNNQRRPSIGAHYKVHFSERFSLMYGAFYGSIYPDSLSISRFYQHVNLAWTNGKWEQWGTADLGMESGYIWGSAQWMTRYTFNRQWSLAQRIEVFYDPNNRCARIGANKSTVLGSLTLCPSYQWNERLVLRLEPKYLIATETILKGSTWSWQLNAGIALKI
jgi:hypothetical protein